MIHGVTQESTKKKKSSSGKEKSGKSQTLSPAQKLATLKAQREAAQAAEKAAAAALAEAEAEAEAEATAVQEAAKKKASRRARKAACPSSPNSSTTGTHEGSPSTSPPPTPSPNATGSAGSPASGDGEAGGSGVPASGDGEAGGSRSPASGDGEAGGSRSPPPPPVTLEEAQKLIEGLTTQLKKVTEAQGKAKKTVKAIKPIKRPKGKFVLQKRMKLDRNPKGRALYNKILAVVRRHCISVQMNTRKCYRKQPLEKIGSVQLLARKEIKYLTEKRFPGSWTTAEMIKNWIQNQKRARAKRIKALREQGISPDTDEEEEEDDDNDDDDDDENDDDDDDDDDDSGAGSDDESVLYE